MGPSVCLICGDPSTCQVDITTTQPNEPPVKRTIDLCQVHCEAYTKGGLRELDFIPRPNWAASGPAE